MLSNSTIHKDKAEIWSEKCNPVTWGFNSGSAPESTTQPLIFSAISDLDFRLSSMAPYLRKKIELPYNQIQSQVQKHR